MADDKRHQELNTREGKKLAEKSYKATKSVIDAALKGVNDSADKASSELEKTFEIYEKVQNDINKGIRSNVSELEKQADVLKQVRGQLERYGSSLGDLGESVSDRAEDMLTVLNATIQKTDIFLRKNTASSNRAFANSAKLSETMLKGLRSNLNNSERLWKSFTKSHLGSSKKFYAERLEEEQNAMENRLQWLSDYQERYYDQLSDVDKKFFDTEFNEYKKRAEELEDLVKVAGTEISNSISQQVKGIIENVRDIAIVSAAANALSTDIDNFIDNKHQVMARTGRSFNYENYRNMINRSTQQSPFMSRNEFSEVYSDIIKDMRITQANELNYFAKDIASQMKAYGLSADSLERLLWTDKNGGMQGTYRKVSNIAAALEDNENLYVNAANVLSSINENIDKISYLQYKDSDKYTKMYKSLAVLESVSQSSAMKGTEDLVNAVRDMGSNVYDMWDNDFAKYFAIHSGAGSLKNLEYIMQNEGEEGMRKLLLQYQQHFKDMSDDQLAAAVRAGQTPWSSFAEAKEFTNDTLETYLDESIKSISEGFAATESLTEDKAMESVTVVDKFKNEVSGKLGFISDILGELDINLLNLAAIAQIAMSGSELFTKGKEVLFGAKGLLSSGSSLASGASSAGTFAQTGLKGLLGSAGSAAGAGGAAGAGSAAGAGGTLAALGSTAALAGGVAGGGLMAFDGVKGAMDQDKTTGSRVASGLEAAGGAVGAGALIALGVSNPVGWVALGIGGIAYFTKKAIDNANYLSGNAEALKDQYEGIKQNLRYENEQEVQRLADLKVQIKKEDNLQAKKQKLIDAGIANEKDLQGKSEENLNALIDSYLDASLKMNEITDSLVDSFAKEDIQKASIEQKDFLGDIEEAMMIDWENGTELSGERMEAVFKALMSGVTDEAVWEKWNKAMEDEVLDVSEANDILYGGMNAWFDEDHLGKVSIDASALERAAMIADMGDYEFTDYKANAERNDKAAKLVADMAKLYKKASSPEGTSETKDQLITSLNEIKNSDVLDVIKANADSKVLLDDAIAFAGIPEFAKGLSNVPNDGFAYIHEGEAILTKDQAVEARADGGIQSKHIGVDDFEEDTMNILFTVVMLLRETKELSDDFYKVSQEFYDDLEYFFGIKKRSEVSSAGGGGGGAYNAPVAVGKGATVVDTMVDYNTRRLLTDANSSVARTDVKNSAALTVEDLRDQDLLSWSVPNVEDLNAWINEKVASYEKKNGVTSAFRDNGQAFLNAAAESGLDPRYLIAHAILESAGGTDHKALKSNNYFGYGAFDSNVSNMYKYSYGTVEEGLTEIAKKIAKGYYSQGYDSIRRMRWNGKKQYATATHWDTSIAEIMMNAPENTDYWNVNNGKNPNKKSSTGLSWIDLALKNEGYKEGPNNANAFSAYFGMPNAQWCASFVSWALAQSEINDKLGSTSVSGLWGQAQKNGMFHSKNDGYIPKPGDIFINKGAGASHTGFVVSVNDDGTFTTIEGNASDQVKSVQRSLKDSVLTGFISMEEYRDKATQIMNDFNEDVEGFVPQVEEQANLLKGIGGMPSDVRKILFGEKEFKGYGGMPSDIQNMLYGGVGEDLTSGSLEMSAPEKYPGGMPSDVYNKLFGNKDIAEQSDADFDNGIMSMESIPDIVKSSGAEVVNAIKNAQFAIASKLDSIIGNTSNLSNLKMPMPLYGSASVPADSDSNYIFQSG